MYSQSQKKTEPVITVNGLSVNPTYNFENTPAIDILIISGGEGTRIQMKDVETLNWIKKTDEKTLITASICSGSTLLGVIGLLDNQEYCTHHEVYDQMIEIVPSGFPQKSKRFVGFDKIYTSWGISAGIDLSFHIVETLHGKAIAQKTADYMEYDITRNRE
ncbi:MAG: DJ-1/PfpI family protein [Salinivirgaceae bacterium]|nr:DJ-1/PfpI family protein [Salinivirgaceae bacterium]MDD4747005.1 DJ-1/PfpI family protein [Salinivirgaceae bacterium]MDY0280832.1 DJ-1/PfpI family protein [Salinivirgaceae bacterium]